MTSRMLAAAVLAVAMGAAAGPVAAQGFAGADLSAEVLGLTDDLEQGETKYGGGAEFDLWGGTGFGANLAFHGTRGVDLDGRNLTVHGLYDLGDATALGLFYGRDALEDDDLDVYGIEGATDFRGLALQGAAGRFEGDADEGTLLSLEAAYSFGALAATGRAGLLRGDVEASRVAVGGEYRLGRGPAIFAELGRLGYEGDGEGYVSIGARLAIGPNRGTTFGNRGVLEIAPGLASTPDAADPEVVTVAPVASF